MISCFALGKYYLKKTIIKKRKRWTIAKISQLIGRKGHGYGVIQTPEVGEVRVIFLSGIIADG